MHKFGVIVALIMMMACNRNSTHHADIDALADAGIEIFDTNDGDEFRCAQIETSGRKCILCYNNWQENPAISCDWNK